MNPNEPIWRAAEKQYRNNSLRHDDFLNFSLDVLNHIESYTVPQYGDKGSDQMTTASLEDIQHDMKRYINRMLSNARGKEETKRDMLKIAHYAQIARDKM